MAAPTPCGYCEQCGYYRHVSDEVARPEELKRYCVECKRPCCFECTLAERDNRNHTVIPLSQARDNLMVRLPEHATQFSSRVHSGHGEGGNDRRGCSVRGSSGAHAHPDWPSHWLPFVCFPFAPPCRVSHSLP